MDRRVWWATVYGVAKNQTGRDWGQEEKGTPEDEMPGWHHRLDGHEFGPLEPQASPLGLAVDGQSPGSGPELRRP